VTRNKTPEQTRHGGWLTTFNDLVTLLMVFFVLLFAMGSIDVRKVKHFQSAMQSALGVLHEGRSTGVAVEEERSLGQAAERIGVAGEAGQASTQGAATARQGIAPTPSELIQAMITTLDNTRGIDAVYTSKGLLITLDDHLLFELGQADINPQGLPLLERVGTVLQKVTQPVRVEGHTDDLPINTPQFPSNWELSTARAVKVVKYFIERGGIDPQRLSAVGYGSSKPRAGNDTPANRARNRRVEIVLEVHKGK
jgi:chemotaxis protein MotB